MRWLISRLRLAAIALLVITVLMGLLYKVVPSTFIPQEDQGFYIVSITLPEGTSLNRTLETTQRLAAQIKESPGVENVMNITGLDILSNGAKPNTGTMFVGMKEWSERETLETSLNAAIGRTFGLGQAVTPEAFVIAFNPPSLPGLGAVGGFNMQLLDMSGHTDTELDEITKRVVAAANQRPELMGVYSTY